MSAEERQQQDPTHSGRTTRGTFLDMDEDEADHEQQLLPVAAAARSDLGVLVDDDEELSSTKLRNNDVVPVPPSQPPQMQSTTSKQQRRKQSQSPCSIRRPTAFIGLGIGVLGILIFNEFRFDRVFMYFGKSSTRNNFNLQDEETKQALAKTIDEIKQQQPQTNITTSASSISTNKNQTDVEDSETDNKDENINETSSSSLPSSSSSSSSSRIKLDVAVKLSGEMGNNLGKVATGQALVWLAEDFFDDELQLVPRYVTQGLGKSRHARLDLELCFAHSFNPSKFKEMYQRTQLAEFSGKDAYYQQLEANQTKLIQELWANSAGNRRKTTEDDEEELTPEEASRLMTVNDVSSITRLKNHLKHLLEVAKRMKEHSNVTVIESNVSRVDDQNRPTLSQPFLLANKFADFELVDYYWDRFQDFLQYNYEHAKCCNHGNPPMPNDTVLHVRAFNIEMPRAWHNLGFDELTPNRTANELLKDLSSGNNDSVAIISRFGKTHMQPWVDALERRGIPARSIDGNSGTQDFCFLLKAQRRIVGTSQSTFFKWATFLSTESQSSIVYHLNTSRLQKSYLKIPVTERIKTGYGINISTTFQPTHPKFQLRNFTFPLFPMK